jgi:hypothetical protein
LLLPAPEPSDGDEPPSGAPPSSCDPQLHGAAINSETQIGNAHDAALQGMSSPESHLDLRPATHPACQGAGTGKSCPMGSFLALHATPMLDLHAFRGHESFCRPLTEWQDRVPLCCHRGNRGRQPATRFVLCAALLAPDGAAPDLREPATEPKP